MASMQHVRCPQCGTRLCDRTPGGYAAGHFRCRCKLEVIVEVTPYSEIQLIVVADLTAGLAPFVVHRTSEGHGLVLWADYVAISPRAKK